MDKDKQKTVAIIGAGLVGSLAANIMAKRGYRVELFEKRQDIRKMKVAKGRSINLALSNRARVALRMIGLEDEVLKAATPMKGRLIHDVDGNTKSVPYDSINGQCLYSISRNFLNKLLIQEMENKSDIKINFNCKLIDADFTDQQITFLNIEKSEHFSLNPDFVIAADGAHSVIRRVMQHRCKINYSQTFIDHGYIELTLDSNHGHLMVPNHLHIWPRGTFMMIALPNLDGSWTVTLFMPFEKFNALTTSDKLLSFFNTTFPDFLALTTSSQLIKDFFRKQPLPLISVKCEPYHQKRFLLIGDAAHAMVPFYGQGMNAGFEDCSILSNLLDRHCDNVDLVFERFTELRRKDVFAICDLAMYNYEEMRDLVTKTSYRLRKSVDETLYRCFPGIWIPLYNSVTFTSMGYNQCMQNRQWQNRVLMASAFSIILSIFLASYIMCNII